MGRKLNLTALTEILSQGKARPTSPEVYFVIPAVSARPSRAEDLVGASLLAAVV